MANTNDLKNIIEPALLERFWKTTGAEPILPSVSIKKELLGMKFDGIGIHRDKRILHLCEATVSGYLGNKNRDFHIGAAKKFSEAFARFSIVLHTTVRDKLLRVAAIDHAIEFASIECHLVVPEGSRFVRALGYRNKLLELGVMSLVEVKLSDNKSEIIESVLRTAREEMTKVP